jgi:tRNA dimethylallyltransferase
VKRSILALVGPTAVGKSEIALRVAEHAGAWIISADSMQVYRGMDVGTDKPAPAERDRVPHYMIDVIDPTEDYSVADYVEGAGDILKRALDRKTPVVVCGGTGYYFRGLLDGLCESPPGEPDLRRELAEEARRFGDSALHDRLAAVDPEAASKIHPNNVRRTIRALEIYLLTGRTVSSFRREQEPTPWRDEVAWIGLLRPWTDLDERISARVKRMMDRGLLEEVERLIEAGCTSKNTALQGLGYKELAAHLAGETTLEEAVEKIRRATRRYARRQMTWWRPDKRISWISLCPHDTSDEIAGRVMSRWTGENDSGGR